jgi:predicted pyridoxine 5'-phosphate oxidase superfamily flavin-nucleotide-binding protein
MARELGSKLIVDISRKPGEQKILNLMELFNSNPNRIIGIAGTVNEDGTPNTAPISFIFAKDEQTLLIALLNTNNTTQNVKRNGKICIEILGANDLAIGIKGTAKILRDPMESSSAMIMAEVKVEKVKQDTSPAQIVIQGPASTPRSEKAKAFEQGVIAEMMKEIKS